MRSTIVAAFLALGSLVAVPAFAAPPARGEAPAKSQRAEEGRADKRFPMPAAEFKAKVDQRQARARAHMEERAAKLPAGEAKELRERFEATVQRVNAEVAKAVADGTVTKEEAKAVRDAGPHHGRHARRGHHKERAK
jgi:hypothetical protein